MNVHQNGELMRVQIAALVCGRVVKLCAWSDETSGERVFTSRQNGQGVGSHAAGSNTGTAATTTPVARGCSVGRAGGGAQCASSCTRCNGLEAMDGCCGGSREPIRRDSPRPFTCSAQFHQAAHQHFTRIWYAHVLPAGILVYLKYTRVYLAKGVKNSLLQLDKNYLHSIKGKSGYVKVPPKGIGYTGMHSI